MCTELLASVSSCSFDPESSSADDLLVSVKRFDGKGMAWFRPPEPWTQANGVRALFSPAGDELWLFYADTPFRLARFALP